MHELAAGPDWKDLAGLLHSTLQLDGRLLSILVRREGRLRGVPTRLGGSGLSNNLLRGQLYSDTYTV